MMNMNRALTECPLSVITIQLEKTDIKLKEKIYLPFVKKAG